MEITVTLREIVIRDNEAGEEFVVQTLRTARDIVDYIEESEKDELTLKLQDMLGELYCGDHYCQKGGGEK